MEQIQNFVQKHPTVYFVEVRKDGKILDTYSKLFKNPTWEYNRMQLYSATKGVTSAAAGIAVGEGLFSLEDKVYKFFPEYVDETASENLKAITVYDLLNMGSGLDDLVILYDSNLRRHTKDWVKYFFDCDFKKPGEKYFYASLNTHMVAAVIEKTSGMTFYDYICAKLFEPLEIYYPDWLRTPTGTAMGGYGLLLAIDEMGRFGQMILDGGVYNGKQVVPKDYVEKLWEPQWNITANMPTLNISGQVSYSHCFMSLDPDTIMASGYQSQYIVINRAKNAVISILAVSDDDMTADIWSEILEKL